MGHDSDVRQVSVGVQFSHMGEEEKGGRGSSCDEAAATMAIIASLQGSWHRSSEQGNQVS